MLSSVLLLPLALVLVSGMTVPPPASTKAHHHGHHGTHPPKPSHEPGVESHYFNYIKDIHLLVLTTKTACYVMKLYDTQVTDVHSPSGLRQLEVELLSAVDNTATLVPMDASSLNPSLKSACTRHHNLLPAYAVN